MTLPLQRLLLAATFLGLHGLLGGCFAQSEKLEPPHPNAPASSAPIASSTDRVEILKTVRIAFETPTQKYLCAGGTQAVKAQVRNRFANVFSDAILNEFLSEVAQCEILASARFGFDPLDTPEAIRQTYSLKFGEPYTLKGETIAEVRFWPIIKGKPGGEGGAIVYLKKLNGSWKISNIESVAYLGANGFQSLVLDYPTVSSDVWADMDYTNSLTRPAQKH